MRRLCFAWLLAVPAAAQDIAVPLTRDRWTFAQLYARDQHFDTARFETPRFGVWCEMSVRTTKSCDMRRH